MLREVSKKITLVANFGIGQTGLATVGYKLWNGDGTQFQARTTTNVSEIRAGTGSYKVELSTSVFTADFDGYVEWDTGGGSPIYIYEDVHIVAELDAAVSSRTVAGDAMTLTSAYDPAKTAAQPGDAMALTSGERTTLTAAMWSALTSGLTTVGSVGKLLVTNIDAAISTRSTYDGTDTSGTTTLLGRLTSTRAGYIDDIPGIAAATDLLGTGVITYGGPVLAADRIELVQGDDYLTADGRALTWSSADWPSLTGSTVSLSFRQTTKPHASTAYPGSVVSATEAAVELTAAQTDTFEEGTWSFALKAALASSGHEVTLAEGTAVIVEFP